MRFPLSSVRARLTVWSVSVLAVTLLAFGGMLRYWVESDILRALDEDMVRNAGFVTLRWAQRDDHNGNGGGGGFGRPFSDRGRFQRKPGDGPPPMPRDGNNGLGSITRPQPRMLTLDGKDMRQVQEGTTPPDGPWDRATFEKAARGQGDLLVTIRIGGEPVRILSTPLRSNQGEIEGVLQVARPLTELNWALDRLTQTLLLFLFPSLLIAGVGGAFLTSRALRPVRDITQAASTIEAEDLSGRLPESGGDEFAHLAATFNAMLGRLERSFEQQRRFTADASHELRTPLAAIKAHTSLALSNAERTPEQYRKTLQTVDRSVDGASRIVQDLLLLARSDTGRLGLNRVPTPIVDVLLAATETVDATAGAAGRPAIHLDLPDPAPVVCGDSHHLTRLFTNLLENAVRHTPPDGRVAIAATASAESVVVSVTDTGEGIAAEHVPHLGERFYRVDGSRARASGGTGLGLAICRSIADAHGGAIAIESEPGQGTRVSVTLPPA